MYVCMYVCMYVGVNSGVIVGGIDGHCRMIDGRFRSSKVLHTFDCHSGPVVRKLVIGYWCCCIAICCRSWCVGDRYVSHCWK